MNFGWTVLRGQFLEGEQALDVSHFVFPSRSSACQCSPGKCLSEVPLAFLSANGQWCVGPGSQSSLLVQRLPAWDLPDSAPSPPTLFCNRLYRISCFSHPSQETKKWSRNFCQDRMWCLFLKKIPDAPLKSGNPKWEVGGQKKEGEGEEEEANRPQKTGQKICMLCKKCICVLCLWQKYRRKK